MTARTPIAYVVGVDPVGAVRIRCPFCRRIHIHRRPRHDGEHQPAPCGSPSGYRVTWLRKPPDELCTAVQSFEAQPPAGGRFQPDSPGLCVVCMSAASTRNACCDNCLHAAASTTEGETV